LNKDNKLKIKFVQGQSIIWEVSGVLPNVGERINIQLILSRRHPKLLNGKKDIYGFTLGEAASSYDNRSIQKFLV